MLAVRAEVAANDPRHDGYATPCKHRIMPIQWHPRPHDGKPAPSVARNVDHRGPQANSALSIGSEKPIWLPSYQLNPIGDQAFQGAKKAFAGYLRACRRPSPMLATAPQDQEIS
jgi:hypothetical protein